MDLSVGAVEKEALALRRSLSCGSRKHHGSYLLHVDRYHLLQLARAKSRLAWSLMVIAGAIGLLLFTGRAPGPRNICGTKDPVVDPVVRARRAHFDSLRIVAVSAKLGRAVDPRRGEKLFKGNCASCHKVDKDMTGPALGGILERVPEPATEWLLSFLTNEASLVQAQEPYTLALRETWGMNPWMHRAPDLTEQDVFDLVAWMDLHEGYSGLPIP